MKNKLLILSFLFCFMAHSQSKIGYTRNKTYTTTERNAIDVADTSVLYQLYNDTSKQWENYNHVTNFWEPLFSGSGGGSMTDAEIKTAYENNSNTNAFTDAEKTKLTGIAIGAEVNINADWNAITGDALILNKPIIPTTTSQLTNNSGFLTTEVDGSITNELQTISKNASTKLVTLSNGGGSFTDEIGTDDQTGAEVLLTGYTKPLTAAPVSATDNVNVAIGKLEKSLDDAVSGGVTSVAGKTGVVTLVKADITDFGTYSTDIHSNITALNNVSGVNSGDQNISGIATNANAITNLTTNKQEKITLTTTGTSGAATLTGATLNIPNYATGMTAETDPTVGNHIKAITTTDVSNWNANNAKVGITTTQASNITTNNAKVSNATHTGEVTGSTALTIASNVVTNTKLATMTGNTFKGNNTGVTSNPLDLSTFQVKAMLQIDNVNNTADLNKPISTTTQTALNTKIDKVTTIDNAIIRADGTGGNVQNSNVFISDDGNLSIGNINNNHKLEVTGSIYANTGGSGVGLYMDSNSAIRSNGTIILDADTNGAGGFTRSGSGDILFRTSNAMQHMKINGNGNVSIGLNNNNSAEKLDVSGSVKATSLKVATWEIVPNGDDIEFKFGGVVKMRLKSTGVIEAVDHKNGL